MPTSPGAGVARTDSTVFLMRFVPPPSRIVPEASTSAKVMSKVHCRYVILNTMAVGVGAEVVGICVGRRVGRGEGSGEGTRVGSGVGMRVGRHVGVADGNRVGTDEGLLR